MIEHLNAIERFEKAIRANCYRNSDAATEAEYVSARRALIALIERDVVTSASHRPNY